MAINATGVEFRFVLKGEKAVIKMCVKDVVEGVFHVFRGGIQGGWEDHEMHKVVTTEPQEFVIERSKNLDRLKVMAERIGDSWDPEVIRVIFDRGYFKIYDIVGDIEPPKEEQCPAKTMLSYGSSITHGSNSIDMSHSWVSIVAHNLNMDARNLGMAGSCAMEPEMVDYIASEGEKGRWDIATLELGINVLGWVLGLLDGIGQDDTQEQIDEPFTYTPEAEIEEETAPKVEVWRENGRMKEHLKVSSDGQRYYDPEDGEWHNIK